MALRTRSDVVRSMAAGIRSYQELQKNMGASTYTQADPAANANFLQQNLDLRNLKSCRGTG